ncbi:MAG TPA: hypothetical protein PKC13_15830, partial [Blastocatellia bacterium]|nr:hypothetical protein [Blastocatellia bacterium]
MSGTKFRLSCSSCGATFFSPDRRARYCPKCAKKKGIGVSAAPAPTAGGGSPEGKTRRPLLPLVPKKEPKPKRIPKANELTPELTERITQIYQEKYVANREMQRKDVVSKISDELWVGRKVVSNVLPMYHPPKAPVPPEVKAQIVEAYKAYVERGERPEGGRRKTIAKAHGLSFAQVRDIVYEYSVSQYKAAPFVEPSREQKFRLEKLFWAEMDHPRYHWDELPDKLAALSGEFTHWQVARWRDMLLDDEARFASVPDVEPGAEVKILDAYKQYLAAPAPPEQSLHHTIAQAVGDIT